MKDMTLEQALGELKQVVEQLDAGDLDLDQVLNLYERGQHLARHCQQQPSSLRPSDKGDGAESTPPGAIRTRGETCRISSRDEHRPPRSAERRWSR